MKTVALILVLLFTGVSLTEATGVTEFTATVIRIVTGEGTLLIEVDDPSVTVSIDGDQIRITGAGVEELKLRPGRYKFSASKDGQPVKQELVTITRGGRKVVRVTLEPLGITICKQLSPRIKFPNKVICRYSCGPCGEYTQSGVLRSTRPLRWWCPKPLRPWVECVHCV